MRFLLRHLQLLPEAGIFKNLLWEFPLWLSGLRTQPSVREDAGLIPGLPPWVKDPALLRATAQIGIAGAVV